MEVLYNSTRNNKIQVKASEAILKGLSDDGGLFVPDHIPALPKSLKELSGMTYQEVAYEIMSLYLTDFTEEELKICIANAYDSKFDTAEIAPLVQADGAYFLELFHGATIAFKDMALSILPHLMIASARKNKVKNEIVILTATSGDTGKAALAGFAGVEGTRIIVFYPKSGVSPIQERQMVTQKGENTYVVGIHGNFDDAQSGVKRLFADKELAERMDRQGYQFSSANFGNILAAFYAKNMGLPINKLICASNDNKVLYDFFRTGVYDKNREFVLTSSPSMDILISSNLERLVYRIAGDDPEKNRDYMNALGGAGKYEITQEMREKLTDFFGGFASEEEAAQTIRAIQKESGYIIDTHTAVAACVYHKYAEETGDKTPAVIASTASPYKFTRSVMKAIDEKYDAMGDFDLVDELSSLSRVAVPKAIEEIRSAPVVHDHVCEKDEMKQAVETFLGL